jgi:hypothetical protein
MLTLEIKMNQLFELGQDQPERTADVVAHAVSQRADT